MAFYRCNVVHTSGGSDEPIFTSTKICDNTSLGSSLTDRKSVV